MEKYLFVGGDERQRFAAEYIRSSGKYVSSAYTYDELKNQIPDSDIIVLPLPFTRDGKHINSVDNHELIKTEDLIFLLREGMTVTGGMIDEQIFKKNGKGIILYDYYKSESLTTLNSISTAEGVIYELIGNSKINLQGSKTLVTGYGKAASAICNRLNSLGSDIVVAARSEKARKLAEGQGCKAIQLYDMHNIASYFDFVVNTVPALVIDEKVICKLRKDCFMLEIASAPYGIDFNAAEKHGIKAKKAPSLPGRIAPKSAGEAIARTILNLQKGKVSLK